MSRSSAIVLIIFCALVASLHGQSAKPSSPSPTAAAKKDQKKEKKSADNTNPLLGGIKGAPTNGPVTTEIYADDAFFDSNKNVGVFSGHVKVADPRFSLQSEKLTVYITKGENQGLEKAIAEGNVAVVRDRPDPNGGAPTRAVGRSDQATYVASTGNVELRGTPRVQEGVNTHIATSPETVMIVNQNGQLTTHGPSRTEIRQEPKTDEGEKKNESKPAPSPKPTAKS
ncbi:MAG TPA: LptA/OstA family protein [Chthoniobacterales bacterium]|nr:LptA/OstA family protein [Chthoniobacterales bacterium]